MCLITTDEAIYQTFVVLVNVHCILGYNCPNDWGMKDHLDISVATDSREISAFAEFLSTSISSKVMLIWKEIGDSSGVGNACQLGVEVAHYSIESKCERLEPLVP